jgi:hypothetical protein
LPEVTGHIGEGQLSNAQAGGDGRSVALVVLWAAQDETVLELADELGVKAHQLQFKGLKLGAVIQVAVEGDPQHASRFPTDLDAGVAQACGDRGDGRCRSLCTRQVVGHGEAFADLVTLGLVHHAEHNLVQVDIGPDA